MPANVFRGHGPLLLNLITQMVNYRRIPAR